MKKTWLAGVFILTMQGCSDSSSVKKEEIPAVDNAATRYVGSLQTSVNRAETAVERSNAAVEKLQTAINEAQAQIE